MSLMYLRDMGVSIWMRQFLVGFPLTGNLSQQRNFPPTHKILDRKPLPADKLTNSNCKRFHGRARRSGFKNQTHLWTEAMEQHGKGWLTAPFPLATVSIHFALRDANLNIASRLGV